MLLGALGIVLTGSVFSFANIAGIAPDLLLLIALSVVFLEKTSAGILFAGALNNIHLGGYPLGFWFAHQGSIYVFIVLIFWYARQMAQIDRKFDMHED